MKIKFLLLNSIIAGAVILGGCSSKEEKKVSPMSWLAIFDAYQDNNENKINKIEVASNPYKEFMKDQLAELKKGSTLSGAIAYKLTDNTTPVILKAHKGIGGEELGTQEFKIN